MKEQFSSQFRTYSKTTLALLHLASWLVQKNSRHPSNHSDAKLKPSTTWSPAFFPRMGQFACFYLEFWLVP